MLMALASHFWRPDFSPAQSAQMFKDYADDLGGCTIAEIELAIRDYRLKPKIPGKMKPFPGTDDLLELVQAHRKHRRDMERYAPVRYQFGDSRPLMWWHIPKARWEAHWRESEVPVGDLIRDASGGDLREPVRR